MPRRSLGLRHLLYSATGMLAALAMMFAGQAIEEEPWSALWLGAGSLAAFGAIGSLVDLFLLGGTLRYRAGENANTKIRPRCPRCRGPLSVWQLPWSGKERFPCPHCGTSLLRDETYRIVDGQPYEHPWPANSAK